jgi:hypothetical protein
MAAPFVATSRLGNIIQMITLSRQSGILRALRGQGPTRELGQIRFLDGEPVAALLGQLTGGAALDILNNWGECQYAFDELAVVDAVDSPFTPAFDSSGPTGSNPGFGSRPNPYSTPAAEAGRYSPSMSPSQPLSGAAWPVYGYQQSGPLASGPLASGPMVSGPLADLAQLASPRPMTGPLGSYPNAPYPSYTPAPGSTGQTMSGMSPGMPPAGAYAAGSSGAYGVGPAGATTGLMTLVPERTAVAQKVDQLPLDRRERMVLLLVDGQRTVADLARLTRRSEPELQAVLSHLEMLGLLRVAN